MSPSQTLARGVLLLTLVLDFARHLSRDVDGAIKSYHKALNRKPDDPFSSEMLNRALAEAFTYPKSSSLTQICLYRFVQVIGVNTVFVVASAE